MIRKCRKCNEEKPIECYSKHKGAKDGLRNYCKTCSNIETKQYRLKNPERIKELAKEWRDKNPEYQVNWYRQDIDKQRKAWRQSYYRRPLENRLNEIKRRVTKLNATPKWVDFDAIKDVYIEARYMGLVVDHIVPLRSDKVCGLHVWDNLQLLTKKENNLKGNRYWPDMPN
jgi:5-methylcytosine-specific restriction endonuclease McrA